MSCKEKIDIKKEQILLLESNQIQKDAHMQNNPSLLVGEMMDTVLSVQTQGFSIETGEERFKRWEEYFKRVKYYVWDDLEPPLVEVSADGSLASVSVRKITVSSYDQSPIDTTIFAWTSSYKKMNGKWKIYKITSIRE